MSRRLFIFDQPDRFAAGAVGAPGHRSFYLQARQGGAVITLGVEKSQVAALAQRIGEVLEVAEDLVPRREPPRRRPVPPTEPMVELFRVGLLAIGWDPDEATLTVEARPIDEEGDYPEVSDDDPEGPDLLRVRLSRTQGVEFALSAADLVAGGRPTCPFCGQPLDPTGHFCPRMNGHLN